jgi:type II secretory ATPase GspE/PulE/Tfp pilus assembly ATPase PilB-like protein
MRNISANRKVITIEDPAEFIIPHALQNTLTRSLTGSDTHVFDSKLATIKRSAMNDLLIGEIRDTAGGRAFMDLAASGANLYTTVHARSCLLICERLSSSLIGVTRDFLASPGVLKLLVHQMLLPALCQSCSLSFSDVQQGSPWLCVKGRSRTYAWFTRWADFIASTYQLDLNQLRFRCVAGCQLCRRKNIAELAGIDGRTVISEIIEPAREPDFIDGLEERNWSRLRHWFAERPRATWTSDDMFGKSIFDCAIFKVSVGQLDPRFVEAKFGLFNPSFQA